MSTPEALRAQMVEDVVAGLSAEPRRLPPRLLYDTLGSKLFEAIALTPEYYPTRTELGILQRAGPELGAALGPDVAVIELGTGSARRVLELLSALERVRAYVPIDISPAALHEAASGVRRAFPMIEVTPIVADFTRPVELPELPGATRWVVYTPGSNLGSLDPVAATELLATIAGWLRPGDALLVGYDLVKDPAILDRAYNDVAGVTAAFHRNILLHLHRALGAEVDVTRFEHVASYDAVLQRVEMHLRCTSDTELRVAGHTFRLAAGESIHTQSAYKFTHEDLRRICENAGYGELQTWTDPDHLFAVAAYVRR